MNSTSSAEPAKLQTYSNVACNLDADIDADAGRLSSVLARFENSCRDPQFRISASYAASNMSNFANDALPTDEWVAKVGHGFLQADSGALGAFAPYSAPSYLGDSLSLRSPLLLASGGVIGVASSLKTSPTKWWHDWNKIFFGYHLTKAEPIPNSLKEWVGFTQHLRDYTGTIKKVSEIQRGIGGAWKNGYFTVTGSEGLKQSLGWAKKLTRYKPDIVGTKFDAVRWNRVASTSFKDSFDTTFFVDAAITVAFSAADNYEEYGSDTSKVVIGTTVDSAFEIGGGIAGRAIGTWGFGAIGMAIAGPPGAAIGAYVGGQVGEWVGEWAGEKLHENTDWDERATEAIDGVYEDAKDSFEDAFDGVANQVADLFA